MTREEREKEIVKAAEKMLDGNPNYMSTRELAFVLGAHWADEHPYWISVEDELPKDRQPCIVLIDRKAIQGTPRIRSAVYAPNVMMQQEGFAYSHMSKKHHITHWMPLPDTPKKGGAL